MKMNLYKYDSITKYWTVFHENSRCLQSFFICSFKKKKSLKEIKPYTRQNEKALLVAIPKLKVPAVFLELAVWGSWKTGLGSPKP